MKIYNKIILEWNEETQNYDNVVYEDSYEYDGELMTAGGCYDAVTDIEGSEYPVVEIGPQCWMAENLAVTKFWDRMAGSSIPYGGSNWDFPYRQCYDDHCDSYLEKFGYLYNWYAAIGGEGNGYQICPAGWHVPSRAEFTTLGYNATGTSLKEVGCEHWVYGQDSGNNCSQYYCCNTGINTTGFSGRGGGFFYSGNYCEDVLQCGWCCSDGADSSADQYQCPDKCGSNKGLFWSTTAASSTHAYSRLLHIAEGSFYEITGWKMDAMNIRCVHTAPVIYSNYFWFTSERTTNYYEVEEFDVLEDWINEPSHPAIYLWIVSEASDGYSLTATSNNVDVIATPAYTSYDEFSSPIAYIYLDTPEDFVGEVLITVSASHNIGGQSYTHTREFTVNILPQWDTPECTASVSVPEDSDYYPVVINCTIDEWDSVLSIEYQGCANLSNSPTFQCLGVVEDCSGTFGNFTCYYTPADDYIGSDDSADLLLYSVLTEQYEEQYPGWSGVQKGTNINVTATADAPVCPTDFAGPFDEDSAASSNPIDITCTTNEYETITGYTIDAQPSYGTLSGTAPDLFYEPDDDYRGVDLFTYTAEASHGGTSQKTVEITISPVADPVTCDDQTLTHQEGSDLAIFLTCAVDPDNEWIVSYTTDTTDMDGTLSCSNDMCIWYPPNVNYNGSTSFGFTGTATDGGTDTGTIIINVVDDPDPPIINLISDTTMTEHQSDKTIAITASDIDTPIADLEWDAISTVPQEIDLDITSTSTGADLVISLDGDWYGDANITVYVYDDVNEDSETFQLTVTPEGDAPVCPGSSVTINEDIPKEFSFTCVNEAHEEGINPATYEIDEAPSYGTAEVVEIVGDEVYITYTPNQGWFGDDSFTYRVQSETGAVWSNSALVSIEVISVSDQPEWLYITTGIGIIDYYAGNDVIGWAATGAAIYEDTYSEINFVVDLPVGYDCGDLFWTIDSSFTGTLLFDDNHVCNTTLMLTPNLDWNTYSHDGTDFVDNPVDVTITVTPTGGDALSLTFPISVVPTSDLPLAPDMYAAQNYDNGIGFIFGPQWNQMSFIWHKSGIDESEQESGCGDGLSGVESDNDCIYDPDPYDNNVWWTGEHGWICDGEPELDSICTGAGSCGSSTCIETTPMYTYQAVMITGWNNFNHGGDPLYSVPGRCDNALTPLLYTQNVQGGNEEILIQEDDLPFMFPTVQDTDVPYFMPDVSGDVIDLRLTYQCENWAYDGIWVPYDFEIYYRVVECMYFTTNGGTVHHWGQPYCAESDELDWECDDDNPLKCSADESEMFLSPTIEGSRADFGLGGPGGRSGNSLTFVDQSELEEGETIVTWNWDFGHGEPSNSDNPTHTYPVPEPGEGQKYTVELTIGIDTTGSNTVDEEKIMQREVWIGSISHDADWNMVSVPVEAHDMLYDALFPGAIPGTLYAFDGTYSGQSELLVGKGYWLRFYSAGENIVAGLVPKLGNREIALIELNQEWNLIGGLTFDMDFYNDAYVSDPQGIIVPGTLYGLDGTYSSTSTLQPGKGYWVKADDTDMISIHEAI